MPSSDRSRRIAPQPVVARHDMVERHLRARDIAHPRVLAAMATVPREEFVPTGARRDAYDDRALGIGEGQTISQPYVVALMAQALDPTSDDRVLEVGTGSGYAAAVLSRLVAHVTTVERLPELARAARLRLARLGYDNVEVVTADGTLGAAAGAPYDGITIAAAGPGAPASLLAQLAPGGRLVMPVGPRHGGQRLLVVTRTATGDVTRDLGPVAFVPLLGAEGW